MKLATTTEDFNEYTKDHKEMVKYVVESGFKYIDLSMYDIDIPGSPFMDDNWMEYTISLKEYAQSLGATFVQAHSPGMKGNVLINDEYYDYFFDATKRSIEVCSVLGIKNIVFHTGFKDGVNKEDYYKINADFIRKLIPTIEKCGVNLCIENSTKRNMKEKYFFFDGKDMSDFIDYMGHPMIKGCWDIGHANLEGHSYQDIIDLGDKLTTLHIHDNYNADTHQMPFTGTVNMDEVMQALVSINYNGYFTMEASRTITPGKVRKNKFDNELLRTVPLEFKIQAEKLLYNLGKWVLESYNCFEE